MDPSGLKVIKYSSPQSVGTNLVTYYSTNTKKQYFSEIEAMEADARVEMTHMEYYMTKSHIANLDQTQRLFESWQGWLHDWHCNEIAYLQMYKAGYNPGLYSQNTTIPDAVYGYIRLGKATALPTIGTVGYIYYWGKDKVGNYNWNHVERYEYGQVKDEKGNLQDILFIYRTSGQSNPERETLTEINKMKIIGDLSKDIITCVAMDQYDPTKSGWDYDTSDIGFTKENTKYPDEPWETLDFTTWSPPEVEAY